MLTVAMAAAILGAAYFAGAVEGDPGGADIASAPILPIGQQITGGRQSQQGETSQDYWRVMLKAGDRLTIDYSGFDGDHSVNLCLLAPSVTDYTLNSANCLANDSVGVGGKDEFSYLTPLAGAFILDVGDGDFDNTEDLVYELTARVSHALAVSLSLATKALVAAGRTSTLTRSGTVTLLVSSPAGAIPPGGVGGTLSGRWAGTWHQLSRGTYRSGKVALKYRLPATAHGGVTFRINVGGGTFIGKTLTISGLHA
jgi:hypothetical protein